MDEVPLDPGLAVVDAHHHLADRIPDGFAALVGYRRFLLDEYLDRVITGHNVVASVYMEARTMYRADGPEEMRPVGETEFANGQAAMAASGAYGPCRVAAGIVAFAELSLGDRVAGVLEAHLAAAPARLRGIRQEGMFDPDPAVLKGMFRIPEGLYSHDPFRAGFARLAPLGLSFDAFVLAPQLGDVIALARSSPQTSVIVNHVGNPVDVGRHAGRLETDWPTWHRNMAALADCANVTVKLGGLGTFLMGFPKRGVLGSEALAALWRPYVETAVELFGADRCMFESNLPLDQTGGFGPICNAYKRITAGCSLDERKTIFAGTADRVYRLGLKDIG